MNTTFINYRNLITQIENNSFVFHQQRPTSLPPVLPPLVDLTGQKVSKTFYDASDASGQCSFCAAVNPVIDYKWVEFAKRYFLLCKECLVSYTS